MDITEAKIIRATRIALRAKKIAEHSEECEQVGIDPSKVQGTNSNMYSKLKQGLDKKLKQIEIAEKCERHGISYEDYVKEQKKLERTKERRATRGWE